MHTCFNAEFWLGIVRANHTDFILSILLFLAHREKVNDFPLKRYLIVCLVSIMFLGLLFLYFYMAWTINRLTIAYYKYAVIEVADMKDEPLRCLLAELEIRGSSF